MLKWIIIAVVAIAFIYWLKQGREHNSISDAEAKEVDQNRFYVNTDDKNDPLPDDDKSNQL
jgi:hypothetical protein